MTDDVRIPALIDVLESWDPPTERSAAARAGMVELLHTSAAPFSREHDAHHFTAGGVVVSDRGFLLHKHKLSGDWIQPGGHIDDDEWPADAATREVQEETGITAHHPSSGPQLLSVDVHVTVNKHVHYDLEYLLSAQGVDPQPPAGESPDVGWFSQDTALSLTDDVGRGLIVAASAYSVR